MSGPVRVLLATAATTLVAACASPPPKDVADGDKQVCTREMSVGSIRPTTTCRTVAQIEREREQAQKDMNFLRQQDGSSTN